MYLFIHHLTIYLVICSSIYLVIALKSINLIICQSIPSDIVLLFSHQ